MLFNGTKKEVTALHRVAVKADGGNPTGDSPATPLGHAYRWGKIITTWASGNTVSVHPCRDSDGNDVDTVNTVTVYLSVPLTNTPIGLAAIMTANTIIPFFRLFVGGVPCGLLANTGGGQGAGCVVKITSNAAGGGKYNGRMLTGASAAVAAGTLAMPEGLTLPGADDTLILNASEDGLTTHALAANTYWAGQVVGVAAGLNVVVISASTGAGSGLPSNAGHYKYQVLQLSDNNATGVNNPAIVVWDWVRAH